MHLIIINRINKMFKIILCEIFVHSLYKSSQIIAILKILLVGANKFIMYRRY